MSAGRIVAGGILAVLGIWLYSAAMDIRSLPLAMGIVVFGLCLAAVGVMVAIA